MLHRFTTIISLLFISISSYAQPSLMWANAYNGPQDNADQAVSVAVDASGNSYVTGGAFQANGTLDMVTIKYSPAGQQLWLHNFNGSADANDQGNMLVLDASGNVYVTGYTNNLNSGQDITTIKYNSSGVMQWVQYFDGTYSNTDIGIALVVDNSGNVYVTGTQMMPGVTTDFITIKYNTAGALQWFQSYNGPANANDDAKDIKVDVNGNVYVTGTSDTLVNSTPNEDIVLLKYNGNGVPQWRKVYDDSAHGYQFSKKLTIDRNQNIIVAGYSFVTGHGYDYFIFKWDSSGVFKWM
ncbi:MAG TPA: SBBP repeat-containing protein, partial [Bacteroidia bacterium]|nr:SBBP repeat-containing protein [Bacteroidia bacterium]